MADEAIIYRLNFIIVLLLAILGVLLYPLLPTLFVFVGAVVFIALAVATVWGLTQAYR